MKFFLVTTMFLSFGLSAQTYEPNDGKSSPGTFTSKSGAAAASSPVTSESGITNSSGITTDQMNTSPNAAPTSDAEAQQDTTLSGEVYDTGPYTREGTFDPKKPDEIQAQEESALDYSTTPKKRTTTPLGPNKK